MTRNASIVLGLLLIAAPPLAGCIGDDVTPGMDPASDGPASETAGVGPPVAKASISGCIGYSVQAPLPWDAVAEALPEGFEPVPFDVPGPGDPTDDRAAQGFFDGWQCQEASVGNASVGQVTILLPKVEVAPPSEVAPPGDQRSYIPLFAATDAPRVAETLSAWGWRAETGQPVVETTGMGPTRSGFVQGEAGGTQLEARVNLGDTPATTFSVTGEASRYFLTDPPLFQEEAPEVTAVVDRSTTNATGAIGQGHFQVSGGAIGQALGPGGPGLGFDTQGGGWGETFGYRPVEAVR